jgi:CheY-like chemotaxis protein
VLNLFKRQAATNDISLGYIIKDKVPAELITDKLRLKQILTNLVSNANKFTSSGSIQIIVDSAGQVNDQVKLSFEVRDSGIGISADHLSRLFKPFSQGDASITRRFGGTGLGLVICERLVELLGGSMSIESTPHIGTSIFFSLVAGFKESKPVNQLLPVQEKLSADFAYRFPMNILVAEDNFINQKVIKRLLEKLGYQPVIVNNGREALELVCTNKFEIILMDVQMPEIDGLEATRIIRTQTYHQPVIVAMTASAMAEDKADCLTAGMNHFVSKPISIAELLNVFEKVYQECVKSTVLLTENK